MILICRLQLRLTATGGGALSASGGGKGAGGDLSSSKPERGWGPSCAAAGIGEGCRVTPFTKIPV